MRCAACGADNSAEALRCSSCGEKISRRRSRRDLLDEVASPFARRPDSRQPLALWAYRCSVLSLIPLLGLVLGAVAVGLALLAWGPVRKEANGKSKGLVITASHPGPGYAGGQRHGRRPDGGGVGELAMRTQEVQVTVRGS